MIRHGSYTVAGPGSQGTGVCLRGGGGGGGGGHRSSEESHLPLQSVTSGDAVQTCARNATYCLVQHWPDPTAFMYG